MSKWISFVGLLLTSTSLWPCQIVTQWYFGEWRCQIDGRPSTMTWEVVTGTSTICNGDICSSSQTCSIGGKFSDSGGPFVPLGVKQSDSTQLFIRYLGPEPNDWFLALDAGGRAVGWTTWRGKQYPLKCQKQSDYRACIESCNEEMELCKKDAHTGPQRGQCAREYQACKKSCN